MKYIIILAISLLLNLTGCAIFTTYDSKEMAEIKMQQAAFISKDLLSLMTELYGPGQTAFIFEYKPALLGNTLEQHLRQAGYSVYNHAATAHHKAVALFYIIDNFPDNTLRVGVTLGHYKITRLYQQQGENLAPASGFTLTRLE